MIVYMLYHFKCRKNRFFFCLPVQYAGIVIRI